MAGRQDGEIMATRDQRIIANALNHSARVVETRRGNWVSECTCGYRSTQRKTIALATETAIHHYELVARLWKASGQNLPAIPNTPTDAMIECLYEPVA